MNKSKTQVPVHSSDSLYRAGKIPLRQYMQGERERLLKEEDRLQGELAKVKSNVALLDRYLRQKKSKV